MKNSNVLIFGGMVLIGLMIGGNLITYIFGGLITLVSFMCLVESSKTLQKIVSSMSLLLDILFCIFGFYATVHFGVTISMSMLVAGIGYTLIYRPYLNEMSRLDKESKDKLKSK